MNVSAMRNKQQSNLFTASIKARIKLQNDMKFLTEKKWNKESNDLPYFE